MWNCRKSSQVLPERHVNQAAREADLPPEKLLSETQDDESSDEDPAMAFTAQLPELLDAARATTVARSLVPWLEATQVKLVDETSLASESFTRVKVTWRNSRYEPLSNVGTWLQKVTRDDSQPFTSIIRNPDRIEEFLDKLKMLHDRVWDERAENEAVEEEVVRIVDEAHGCW